MEPYYPLIKQIHIASALASGGLFFLRGAGLNLFAARWPMTKAVRRLSWAIDTVLLAAAVMLMIATRQYPGVTAWLTVKVGLVIVYIVLGWHALGRAKSRRASVLLWIAALCVFGFIYTIARAHHPLGVFALG